MAKIPVHPIPAPGGGGIKWTKTGERMITKRPGVGTKYPAFTGTDYHQFDVVVVRLSGTITMKCDSRGDTGYYLIVAGSPNANRDYPCAGIAARYDDGLVTKDVNGTFLFTQKCNVDPLSYYDLALLWSAGVSVDYSDIETVYERFKYMDVNNGVINIKQEIWGGKIEF